MCTQPLYSGTILGTEEADVGLQGGTWLLPQLSAHSWDWVWGGSLSLALSQPPEEMRFLPTTFAPLPVITGLTKFLAGRWEELGAPASARWWMAGLIWKGRTSRVLPCFPEDSP